MKKLIATTAIISCSVLVLTGCSTGPNQDDVYACEDWASAYSTLSDMNVDDDNQMAGFFMITAESYVDASDLANDPELSDLLYEVSSFYDSAHRMVLEDNPDLLVDVSADDRDIYRRCLELKISPELTSERTPDWYEG